MALRGQSEGNSVSLPDNWRKEKRRLAFRLLVTIILVFFAVLVVRKYAMPVPKLTVRPGDGHVKLTRVVTGDCEGTFQYQQRRMMGDFSGAQWSAASGCSSHVVEGLENGVVYVFRVRVLHERSGTGPPSDEVAVVPVPHTEPSVNDTEVPVSDSGDFCTQDVLGEVSFGHDSTSVIPRSNADLAQRNGMQLANVLRRLRRTEPRRLVVVKGYSSAPGRASYNLDLSELRAEAVIEYLYRRAPAWRRKLVAVAKGERHHLLDGRREGENRRAVVILCAV